MADSTPTSSNNTSTVAGSSSFQRTVCLYDWWLIKAENDFEGKRLAVAGIPSKKTDSPFMKEAMRVFVSAPVIKRYDVFSLETADGIYIIIKGFINEQRTLENGFPSEVFNSFLFGFPPNWESYAVDCFREESATGIDSGSAATDNVPAIDPEILSDEKSISTNSLVSPEEASGDHKKPFPEDECNVSKEMHGANVTYDSGRNRRSARLHNSKVCQQKKKPVSGGHLKHADKKQSSASEAFGSPDRGGLESPVTPVQSQSRGQVNAFSEQLIKNSASKSLLVSAEEALGDHEKPLPEDECNVSKEMGGVNVADGCGGNRRSTRLHNLKVCQQKNKPDFGGPPKHPDKEQSSTSGALENPDGEALKSPATPVQSRSQGQVNTSSEQLVKKSASRISRTFSANTEGCYKKRRVTVNTNVIRPKIKITKSASAVKYSQGRDGSPLIKGDKEKIFSVSPKSLSFRKSRSGRLLLPPLEFWRNQIPVYNADREIAEIQDGASLISPFKGSSPSLNCS